MAHQSDKAKASITSFEFHHNKPEEHDEEKEKEYQSLEEALTQ